MGLNQKAAALKHDFLEQVDDDLARCVERGQAAISELNPAARALGVGDRAPDFDRPEIWGGRVHLARYLRHSPVVLSFYRGGWCPFCSLELQAWESALDDLREAGGELIAVAPEAGDRARAKADAAELEFTIVTDANQEVAESYGLVFELPDAAREAQERLDAPLDRLNADGTWRLPVPATYVIDQRARIQWAHIDDDYTRRAEPDEVIEAVRTLSPRRASA